jgi:RsiW-degrading membrane proteinase PrsW (M82 family)
MSPNDRPTSETGDPLAENGGIARPADRDNIHTQFLKEACILLLGVAIGFLWHMYFSETSQEAHLVVMLSIVILCMVRYIYLIQRSRNG